MTPRLFVVTRERAGVRDLNGRSEGVDMAEIVARHEAAPGKIEADYVYLLSGYAGFRPWLCHRLLRVLSRFAWLPSAAATLPLLLCEEEIIETLRGCDPDVVQGFRLPWAARLEKVISRRQPEWLGSPEGFTRLRPHPSSPVDPRAKVSIVMPTYNGARYLRQAIESCFAQTFHNLELIVVDDGSGPAIRAIVDSYRSDGRLKYVRHDSNQGVATSLNTGFRLATGSYLTWTSDDNYYEASAIEVLVRFLERYGDVDFVYAESYEVNGEGAVTGLMRPGPPSALKVDNYIGPCFLYKRSVYERVGDYRPVFLAEDFDYWIRVARTSRMQRLFRPLYYYRVHPASLTARHSPREVDERVREVKRLNRVGSRRDW